MGLLVSVDNGGTLTDVCVSDGTTVHFVKTLTTPHDLSQCLFDGLAKANAVLGRPDELGPLARAAELIRYSTTQGTNALVERRGPRLGLIASDPELLDRMRDASPDPRLLEDLVGPRFVTLAGAPEPLDGAGSEPDNADEQLRAAVAELTAGGAARLVVCLSGPGHVRRERQLRAAVLRMFPRHLLGAVPVLFAHELASDPDDVRRAWSATLNAFLHEPMERFLFRTEQRLRSQRPRRPLLIFGNDGASSRVSKASALRTYSSGPRGGLEGVRALAASYGAANAYMLDVGGTTTDVGRVLAGRIVTDARGSIGGVEVSLPTSAITSVGVGGSSIIGVDGHGLFVGPRSVGAAPGPACFGLGGTSATITDASLLRGLLAADTYLDSTMHLDVARSERVVRTEVAEPLGLDLPAALAVMTDAFLDRVADALPAGDLGPAPLLVAFGGAGPLAAAGVAARRGIGRVLVPRTAAVFSAFGIGFSDLGQTYETGVDAESGDTHDAAVARLRDRAARDMAGEGVGPGEWDATVETGPDGSVVLTARAAIEHYPIGDAAEHDTTEHDATEHDASEHRADAEPVGTREVLDADGTRSTLPVFVLTRLSPGDQLTGPAVIEGPYFTMPVPAGWHADVTGNGDLLLTAASARTGPRHAREEAD